MLLTGGIGDVFAVESLLTLEERESLKTVYYACPSSAEIVRLMELLPRNSYPQLQHHVILPTANRTLYSIQEVRKFVPELPADIVDFSIGNIFPQKRLYRGSSWLQQQLCDNPILNRNYAVVVPGSDWGQSPGRSFDKQDWDSCLKTLDRLRLEGVVLRKTPHQIPTHPRLVDLQGRTSILESIEILKGAECYLGIDSCLSVLASKVLPSSRISIKSVRGHLYANLSSYYAPRENFYFVGRKLRGLA